MYHNMIEISLLPITIDKVNPITIDAFAYTNSSNYKWLATVLILVFVSGRSFAAVATLVMR